MGHVWFGCLTLDGVLCFGLFTCCYRVVSCVTNLSLTYTPYAVLVRDTAELPAIVAELEDFTTRIEGVQYVLPL